MGAGVYAPLPRGPFDVLLADPPWSYRNDRHGPLQGCAAEQYQTLGLRELRALPIPEIAAPASVLLMWCTWPKLTEGMQLMKDWGFSYKTGLPWVKTYADGRPVFGVGYWFRGATEPLLVGVKGKVPAPPRGSRIGLLGDMVLTAPRGKHSKKPQDIYSLAEEISNHLGHRRIELFAREPRDGWTAWGNQVGVEALPPALR